MGNGVASLLLGIYDDDGRLTMLALPRDWPPRSAQRLPSSWSR